MLARPCGALPPPAPFVGAGIYAIYYSGSCPYYATIARRNQHDCEVPIYVGKAVPSGSRRGLITGRATTYALYGRLREHADSISLVESDEEGSLRLEDFACRYLVVDDIWIPLGAALLIQRFAPVWNSSLDGFGNHDPGSGRYQGQRPAWDVLHPGRPWANRLQPNRRTRDEILHGLAQAINRSEPSSSVE